MPFQTFPLLSGHPLIQTNERSQMIEALRATYKVKSISIAKADNSFLGIINRVDLEHISLQFCVYNAESIIDFLPMETYQEFICFRGTASIDLGQKRVTIDSETTCIIPPKHAFSVKYSDNYAHLVIMIKPQGLSKISRNSLTHAARHSVMLPTLEVLDMRRISRFKAIALCLAYQFSIRQHSDNPAIQQLEQALLSSFLYEHQGNFMESLKAQKDLNDTWQIRMIENYIESNWQGEFNVEDIARVTGISVRSIFWMFKRHRGCSPMAFLRDCRLNHARKFLMDAGDDQSVTAIAMACGFKSIGHFARHYREKFGELPSLTMPRKKYEI
jgi:AraC-like DNA-binding protein